ncbi:MAG: thymidine phosphorylase [Halobacteriovoraceae bacterium]|nr:thymidine phosphorylase [Halobacteriovoraceae bacterium]MBC96851.1 thymidine phosphorylase [Halobacteriovoraceae bacterium]|tara:strand:+ start:151065 stop:152402 length:1338 start_codon:yes stop_codon:yes gene_type:complete
MHSAYTIIAKKRDGLELSEEEIKWFISSLIDPKGSVTDYQMSALLMAIYLNGMTTKETKAITDVMLYSGKTLNFNVDHVVDKHSTGGVGDKTSFILGPIAAACGVNVPMIAGRGLGHTGGTIDKVEAIKGFDTSLSLDKFQKMVEKDKMVLIGQTGEIAPADKKIYALRDVTATIESVPLITASIMSKKLAEGAQGIVMDIKVGNGAFMKNKSMAKKLAKSIRQTGLRFDRNMMTVLSDMNQPLGNAVGNTLEIIESIETLKGNGPKDLTELSIHLAGGMVHLAGLAKTHNAGIRKAKEALKSGAALEEFRKLIKRQGGDHKVIDNYSLLPQAEYHYVVTAARGGYIKGMDNRNIGLHCVSLGGGRMKAEDSVDFGVGFTFHKKVGAKVKEGDPILTIHHNEDQKELAASIADQLLQKDISFSKTAPKKSQELIYETEVSWAKKS